MWMCDQISELFQKKFQNYFRIDAQLSRERSILPVIKINQLRNYS